MEGQPPKEKKHHDRNHFKGQVKDCYKIGSTRSLEVLLSNCSDRTVDSIIVSLNIITSSHQPPGKEDIYTCIYQKI